MAEFNFKRRYTQTVVFEAAFNVEAESEEKALEMLEDDAFYYCVDEDEIDTGDFEWISPFEKDEE